jgi:serine/threonine protein kinase
MSPEQRRLAEAIFQEAAELPADEQLKRARAMCEGDTAVYNEVRSLLANIDQQDTFLANAAFTWPTALPSDQAPPPPQQVPGYRILRMIGQGGMGVVYEAEQQNPRRTVALKVIRPGLASAELMRRFEHEAWVLGQLQHPGIAQIYEAGAIDTPVGRQPFFAMELIRGRTLNQFIQETSPDRRQRLELLARICDAAAHAHQRGVVHRDLKPANILIAEEGAESAAPGLDRTNVRPDRATARFTLSAESRTLNPIRAQPKILDFGVARATAGDTQALSMHTSAGQLIGTLPYMSPEQVGGDAQAVDNRSDIYSLGVILYQLLVDRLPHKLENRSIPEAARIIRDEEPSRLSSIDRSLRGDLETIVEKALDKDPARRYATAGDLASDIRRYLADEPIVARPASALYQFNKFARRNRGAVVFAGLFVLALFATAVVAILAWVRTVQERDIADAERKRAVAEAAKSKSAVAFLQKMLAAADTGQQAGKDLMVRDVLEQAARELDEGELREQPEVELAMRTTIGRTYEALSLFEPATQQMQRALELATNLFGETNLHTALALNNLGQVAAYRDDEATAFPLLERAFRLYRTLPNPDPLELSNVINNYAIMGESKLRLEDIETLQAEVIQLRRAATKDPHPLVAHALSAHANVLDRLGRKEEATRENKEAIDILRRAGQTELPYYLVLLNNIGRMHFFAREYDQAEPLLLEFQQRAEHLYREDNIYRAVATGNLAELRLAQDRAADAEPLARESLRLNEKLHGATNGTTLQMRRLLASILLVSRKLDEADGLCRSLAAAFSGPGNENELDLARVRRLHGDIQLDLGNFDEAETLARQARQTFAAHFGENNNETAKADATIGRALARTGHEAEAAALLRRALSVIGSDRPLDHFVLGQLNVELGELLAKSESPEQAETPMLESVREFAAHGSSAARRQAAAERLSRLYEQLGRNDAAREWSARAASAGPTN